MNYLLQWLVGNLLVVSAVAAILWPLSKTSTLRNRPALRHSLWLLVLVKLVTPPLVTVPVPMLTTQEVVVSIVPMIDNDPFDEDTLIAELPAPFPYEIDSGSMQAVAIAPVESHWTWPEIAAGLCLLSLFVTGLFWLIAAYQIREICRLTGRFPETTDRAAKALERVAAEFKLKKCPTLVVADAACSPMLWVTWRRATILLPRTFEQSVSDEQLRHVLAHEVAHLVRRDHLSSLVAFFVTSLFWFCPVAWLAWREAHIAMEACCDALVLGRLGGSRRSYAQTLLAAIDFAATHKSASPVLAARFGESHSLRRRVEMIANMEVKSTLSRAGRLAVLSCGLVALTLLPVWAEEKPVQTTEVVQEESLANSQTAVAQSGRISTLPRTDCRDLPESPVESDGEQAETPELQIRVSCKMIQLDGTQLQKLGADWSFEKQRLPSSLLEDSDGKMLNTLVKIGVAKVLFAPQLATTSGKTASIKTADSHMEVLPVLQEDGKIRLQVRVDWSQPINDKMRKSSSVDTRVELQSGQTVLLGGLTSTQTNAKGEKRELMSITMLKAELVTPIEIPADLAAKATMAQHGEITSSTHLARLHQKRSQLTKLQKETNDLLGIQTQTNNEHQEASGPIQVTLSCKVFELDRTKLRKLEITLPGDVLKDRESRTVSDLLKALTHLNIAKGIYAPRLTTISGREVWIRKDNMKLEVLPLLQKNGKIRLEVHFEWTSPGEGESDTDPQSIDKVSELRDGQTLTLRGAQLTPVAENGDAGDFETLVLVTVELSDEPKDSVSSPVPRLGAKPLVVELDSNGDPVIDREVPASNKRTELQRIRR